jgi:phage shock protein PspC (stress-responsive transcriptional regulator)
MLGGVAGGLAEYFDIDPTLVRLAFVFATLYLGFGLLPYIILWIVIPQEPELTAPPASLPAGRVEESAEPVAERSAEPVAERSAEAPGERSAEAPRGPIEMPPASRE